MIIPTMRGVRNPVKREGAERYLLLSLISFAASVILTRTFLELTGYPQIGNSQLHIAHVLWGGLLLFVASLLPLILANRWAYNAAAILSGLGVGLFIDEVGKFITQTNDYFYPPAAPIIYAFFMLTVLLYMRVKRPPLRNPRSELYRVLEGLTEVLDHDLDPVEHKAMTARLDHIRSDTEDENVRFLVDALFNFLRGERLKLAHPPEKTRLQRFAHHMAGYYESHINQKGLKVFLFLSLAGMAVLALLEFIVMLSLGAEFRSGLSLTLEPLINRGELRSAAEFPWFFIRVFLEGLTGILLFVSAGLLLVGKERAGVQLASILMIVWLAVINLLTYYFDQFGAVVTTLFQFTVLTALTYYRRKYLTTLPSDKDPLDSIEEQEAQL